MPFRRCKSTIVDQKSCTCSLSNLKILVKVHHSHFFSLSLANTQMKRNSCFPTSYGRNQAECLQISWQKAVPEKHKLSKKYFLSRQPEALYVSSKSLSKASRFRSTNYYKVLVKRVYTNLKVYHFLIKKCTTPNRLRRYA